MAITCRSSTPKLMKSKSFSKVWKMQTARVAILPPSLQRYSQVDDVISRGPPPLSIAAPRCQKVYQPGDERPDRGTTEADDRTAAHALKEQSSTHYLAELPKKQSSIRLGAARSRIAATLSTLRGVSANPFVIRCLIDSISFLKSESLSRISSACRKLALAARSISGKLVNSNAIVLG
jgi:hypothetical protein